MSDISDTEWRVLAVVSGLPDEARHQVQEVVRFLVERPSMQNGHVAELQHHRGVIKKAELGLKHALRSMNLLIESGAYARSKTPLPAGPHNHASAIMVSRNEDEDLRDRIKKRAAQLADAKMRLPQATGGRHRGHLKEAVRRLNAVVLTSTNAGLDHRRRSKVDHVPFVANVFEKGGFVVKDSTVEHLIKELRVALTKRGPRK